MARLSLLSVLLSAPYATCSAWWARQQPARDLPDLAPTLRPKINPRYGVNATAPPLVRPSTTPSSTPQPDCTIVISRAGLDWWYSHTYDYAFSTYQILLTEPTNGQRPYGTAYSLDSINPSPIDVTASLDSPTQELVATIATVNGTLTPISTLSDVSTPPPVAPHTTVHTRSTVNPLPTSSTYDNPNGTYSLHLPPGAYKTLGPVQTTLAEAEPSTTATTITSATPFLRFTDYQVVSRLTRAVASGSVEIDTITSNYNLTSPIGYALAGNTNLNGVLSASGTIPPDFTNAAGVDSTCVLSSWFAEPTVVVVIEIGYAYEVVLAAHTEITQTQLDIPSSGNLGTGPGTTLHCLGPQCTITFATGHLEISQSTLDVPSSFVIPAPTQPQVTPTENPVNNVPRRQQTIGGVSLAPSTPAPVSSTPSPTPSSAPSPDQIASELSTLVSLLSRLGSLAASTDAESVSSPTVSALAVALPTPSMHGLATVSGASPGPAAPEPVSQSDTSSTATNPSSQSKMSAAIDTTSMDTSSAKSSTSATVAMQTTGSSSLLMVPSRAVLLASAIVLSIIF